MSVIHKRTDYLIEHDNQWYQVREINNLTQCTISYEYFIIDRKNTCNGQNGIRVFNPDYMEVSILLNYIDELNNNG